MKKQFIAILFIICSLAVFAQENNMAAGLGLEWNMNSRHNFAGGVPFSFDYRLPLFFAVGFGITGSTNFSGFQTIEATAFLRNYIQRNDYTALFLQIDFGTFIILEDGEVTPRVEIGAKGGYRMPIGTFLYVEPYGRLGVPFAFGIGVIMGAFF